MLKLYPKVGEKTAAEVWGRIGSAPDPLDAFLRGNEPRLNHAREVLRLISGEGMRHNPSESIRLIVERGYGDYARSRVANAQARLDDLEQLSQYALRYEDVNTFLDEVALANPIAGEEDRKSVV